MKPSPGPEPLSSSSYQETTTVKPFGLLTGEARPDAEVRPRTRRRRFTAAYKLRIVNEAEQCSGFGELGALLRREGLYYSLVKKWRQQRQAGAMQGLSDSKRGRPAQHEPLREENEKLRKELARTQKRLQQAELIIDVQKKVSSLLGIPLATPESAE